MTSHAAAAAEIARLRAEVAALREALANEREACAKVVEGRHWDNNLTVWEVAERAAAMIRARPAQEQAP